MVAAKLFLVAGQRPFKQRLGLAELSLGVDDRGVLAAGKLADIVAVAGNPLEDIRVTENVRFVMKGGQVYKNE